MPGVCRGIAGDRRRDGVGNLKPQDRVPTLTPVDGDQQEQPTGPGHDRGRGGGSKARRRAIVCRERRDVAGGGRPTDCTIGGSCSEHPREERGIYWRTGRGCVFRTLRAAHKRRPGSLVYTVRQRLRFRVAQAIRYSRPAVELLNSYQIASMNNHLR